MKLFRESRGRAALAGLAASIVTLALLPAVGQASPAPAAAAGPPGFVAKSGGKPIGNAIVGGKETTFQKHPWLVQITLNGQAFCGGALVHPMLVLTAAHCLYSGQNANWWGNLAPMQAFTSRTLSGIGGEELTIAGWGAADNYDPLDAGGSGGNDWGFLVLSSPSSRPALKIAGKNEGSIWKPGRTGLVAGFGNISQGGNPSPVLKELSTPLLANSVCSAPKAYGTDFNPGNMLCGGFPTGGVGTCQGDSGGPLSVPLDGGGRRIVGVVSWGDGCAKPNKPTVYTRVAAQAVSAEINALARLIGVQANFPGSYADPSVIGSGGKPVGCKAAKKAAKKAAGRVTKLKQKVRKARGKARIRAGKALKKAKRAARKAGTRARTAC